MNLGISIYHDKDKDIKKMLDYIDVAHKCGFRHLFMNLLYEADKGKDSLLIFSTIALHAKGKRWKVVADVNPKVFDSINKPFDHPDTLSYLSSLGITSLRLDEGYGGEREAAFTVIKNNPISLELNASEFTNAAGVILRNNANTLRLYACHNFYPQKYTGLGYARFAESSLWFVNHGIKVGAFIDLGNDSSRIGAWEINDGMPTVECLRNKHIGYQSRFLSATGFIDTMIVAQMYATENELREIAAQAGDKIVMEVKLSKEATKDEEEILFEYDGHSVRGDYSDYLLRSSKTRFTFSGYSLPPRTNSKQVFSKGDVLVANASYGRYKGEVMIVLAPFVNDGRRNLIGSIKKEDLFILDMSGPWRKIKFIKSE